MWEWIDIKTLRSCVPDPISDTKVLATRCCYCCVRRRTDRLVSCVASCPQPLAAVCSLGQMQYIEIQKLIVLFSGTPQIMGRGPGLPAKTCGPSHGPGGHRHRRSISTPRITGRGPGRPMKTRGPPHRLGRAARPGPSNFETVGRDPARPIKLSNHGPGPRPSPAH